MTNDSREIALFLARILDEKKARDTIVLDIHNISFIADYFIISTTQSPTHLKTLSNTIVKNLKENNINRNVKYEGTPITGWMLLDCGDIVIHLFSEEKRDYYHLEYIWQEAKKIAYPAVQIKVKD